LLHERFGLLRASFGVLARPLEIGALRRRLHARDFERGVALANRRLRALVGLFARGVESRRRLVASGDRVTRAGFGVLKALFDGRALRFGRRDARFDFGHARFGRGGARVRGGCGLGGLLSRRLDLGGQLVALADRFERQRLGFLNFLIGGAAARFVLRRSNV